MSSIKDQLRESLSVFGMKIEPFVSPYSGDPGISCTEAEQIINQLLAGGLPLADASKYDWVRQHVLHCSSGRCGRLFDSANQIK